MALRCVEDLRVFICEAFGLESLQIPSGPCPAGMGGDITVNCFRLAGETKSNPMELATRSAEYLSGHQDVEKAEAVKAFVNILVKPEALHRDSLADVDTLLAEARLPDDLQRKILVEYSAPNTNKPLHLGHIRNNAIGMSLVSLLRRIGHDVTAVNLVNDRGIHICKSMVAYLLFGGNSTPESCGQKGDHFVGSYYVKFDQELKRQLADLRDSQPDISESSDEDLFLSTEIGRMAQDMLLKWEQGDLETRGLWKRMNSWVLAGFEETYGRMGVEFDRTYYESDTYLLGRETAEDALAKGVFFRRPDGAVAVDLGPKLGEKVILRPDGTSVYITQDIGTTLMKFEEFSPEMQVWVVGDEQKFHFQALFAIMKRLGYRWAEDLHHLAYGMVNLPSGRMKSREGTVVDADDLFSEMAALARSATLERAGENIPEDLDERAETIAMGALKFMLIKFNPRTTVMFDPEASVRFEGDTGPYVQYACARINSIIRKAESNISAPLELGWGAMASEHERRLSATALQYPSVLRRAGEMMDCSGLAAFLLAMAKDFSSFYRECPVINAQPDSLRAARLETCRAVGRILSDGLATLTIKVPDAM
ncbi:MAG: arginine--tRNA ligase [Victivallales bacterium]|nr:arginine--tRNA ligase [Victivallales bacterium]